MYVLSGKAAAGSGSQTADYVQKAMIPFVRSTASVAIIIAVIVLLVHVRPRSARAHARCPLPGTGGVTRLGYVAKLSRPMLKLVNVAQLCLLEVRSAADRGGVGWCGAETALWGQHSVGANHHRVRFHDCAHHE